MMARRTVGDLFASVEDYGPKRWAQLFIGPPASIDGPTIAVALRRQPTTPDEAQRHLDAIPAHWFRPAYETALVESAAWWRLHEVAARARQPSPPSREKPEWPDETPEQADLFAGVR